MGRFIRRKALLISVFLLSLTVLAGFYFLHSDNSKIVLPVPKIFGATNGLSNPPNDWFPQVLGTSTDNLELGARSAILVDFDSGQVIYAKNPKEKLPVASVVKIMTALIALEKAKPSDVFTVSEKAYKVGEDSMDLSPGEKLTLGELLHGLILVSGNDAAIAIAEGVSGGESQFVESMNRRARELGLSDTRFINASGLDFDGQEQYSTAYDMATISHFLWEKHPEFGKISRTYHWSLDATADHKAFDLYSDTNLLTTYPGVLGIKPGFTWNAGWCLVTYAENSGKRLIGVILGSYDRRGEMKELLDFGFSYYGIKVSHPALEL